MNIKSKIKCALHIGYVHKYKIVQDKFIYSTSVWGQKTTMSNINDTAE